MNLPDACAWPQYFIWALIFTLAVAGGYAAPATARNPTSDPRQIPAQIQADARSFETGLLLMETGRPREAAAIFAAILAQNPRLVRVRLELARAYFLSQQWGRARAEFLSVLSGDLPNPVRANVLRFLRAIDARNGFEWDGDVSIVTLGDTRDYESDEIFPFGETGPAFTLDGRDGGTTRGLRYTFSAAFNQDIQRWSGPEVRTLGFAQIRSSGTEGPGSSFDALTLTGEVGLRFLYPQSSVTFSPSLSRRFNDGSVDEESVGSVAEERLGFHTAFAHRNRQGRAFSFSVDWQDIDDLRNDRRDSDALIITTSVSRPLTPRVSLGVALTIEDSDAQDDRYDFRRTRLTTFGAWDAGRGITLRPNFYVEQRDVPTQTPTIADETGTGLTLTLETDRLILGNGFTPNMRLTYDRVDSDLRAFSYTNASVSFGLERRF